VATQPGRRLDLPPGDPRPDPTPAQPGTVGCAVIARVGVDLAGPGAPPGGLRTAGMSSTTAWNKVVSAMLVAVTTTVSGSPLPSQTRWSLLPGLPRSTGICAHMSPHAWRARSWRPHSPATSPAGPPRPAGPRPPGGARRTRRQRPTRASGARRSRASHSQAHVRAAAARGGGAGHVDDRGEAAAIGNGAVPAAVGGRGGAGSKGATIAHSSSGTRSSMRMVMARDPARPIQRSETTAKAGAVVRRAWWG
jgi:hypothetical protein